MNQIMLAEKSPFRIEEFGYDVRVSVLNPPPISVSGCEHTTDRVKSSAANASPAGSSHQDIDADQSLISPRKEQGV
jgi:hypothetical protein